MNQLLEQQQQYFANCKTRSIASRKATLKRLKNLLQQNEDQLYAAIYKDFKKSEFETFASELALVYHDIDDAVHNIARWGKPKPVSTNWINMPASSKIQAEPLGSVLVIGAWNYPYLLALAPAVAALAAGCTVVLKPSELPKNTSKVLAKLINSTFENGLFHVVEGGVQETTLLLSLRWDKIFFTGSVPVGKIVYQAAAKNLVPVTLELGGKSPAIISERCKLDISVKRLIWAKFLNAGQTCIAPDYVLVHKSIVDQFIKLAIQEIQKTGYSISNHNYVQIINDKNVERLSTLIDPSKVIHGGKVDSENRIITPTLLYPASLEDKSMQDEIFGPILPILCYTDFDEAINVIHRFPKPLSAYLFSNNSIEKKTFLNQLSFGGGAVNDAVMHIVNSNLPFGGVGYSGIGSYHGEAGFKTFSHYKSILSKSTLFEPNLKYAPHTQSKLTWIKRLFKLG